MGDELHSSQRAIDALFTRAIVPYALMCGNAKEILEYFATTNRFTHNFGQAASRAFVLGLEKSGQRGFLTAAGGNGVEYGVKFAGSDEWHVESQVESITMPSKKFPSAVISTWSAMELREGSSTYFGSFSTMPSQMPVVMTSTG